MSFLDQLQADATIFLADTGEWIWYHPRQGIPRRIQAIVDRQPPQRSTDGPLQPVLTITVANDRRNGIATAEVDGRGSDRVLVAPRLGTTPQSYGLFLTGENLARTQQDQGMVTYELR